MKKLLIKLLIKLICRNRWKKLWNAESDLAHWEIWHDTETKSIILHWVPEEDYTKNDIKINLNYDQFKDLIHFLIKIS